MTAVLGSIVVAAVMLVGGCADERELAVGQPLCPDYRREVQPVLTASCAECHGAARADGGYSVAALSAVLARNDDGEAAVIPGDSSSPVLRRAAGENGHPLASAEAQELLTRWIVDCEASTLSNDLVHSRGLLDRASPDFHGTVLRDSGWSFGDCEGCHGNVDSADGGPTGRSCVTCHAQGVTACNTCHGSLASAAPPPALDGSVTTAARGVGAHRTHLMGGPTVGSSVGCAECHLVPANWRAPGHVFLADGSVDPPPAEVTLGPFAHRSLQGFETRRTAPPSYDAATGQCANTYCHGSVLGTSSAPSPAWNAVSGTQSCTRCHELPPPETHLAELAPSDCVTCHKGVVDADLSLVDPVAHMDGKVTLGDGRDTCSSCHGSADNPAPPVSLTGASQPTTPAVGAHQLHVRKSAIAGAASCSSCHAVPAGQSFLEKVLAPGHIDSKLPAELFPGGAAFSGLAARDGATPVYDGTSCANTYCHGGGAGLVADPTSTVQRTLAWTAADAGDAACGSCHGLPPATPSHPDFSGVDQCYFCHSLTVDEEGEIRFAPNGTTTHINGKVDL